MAGVSDIGDKFVKGVSDTGDKSLDTNITANVDKNSKCLYPNNQGPGGKLNHTKNRSQKSCARVSLRLIPSQCCCALFPNLLPFR